MTSDKTHSVIKPINIPIKITRGSVKLGSTIVHELRLSILAIHHQHVCSIIVSLEYHSVMEVNIIL